MKLKQTNLAIACLFAFAACDGTTDGTDQSVDNSASLPADTMSAGNAMMDDTMKVGDAMMDDTAPADSINNR